MPIHGLENVRRDIERVRLVVLARYQARPCRLGATLNGLIDHEPKCLAMDLTLSNAVHGDIQVRYELACLVLLKLSSSPCEKIASYQRLYEKVYFVRDLL